MDYQAEKGEVAADVDKIELNHLNDVRLIKDRIIETEVETRKAKADGDREVDHIEKDGQKHLNKMGDWQVQKK